MAERFLVVVLFLAGCRGELLATAKLPGPGIADARFTAGREVELWSDFAGKWEGRYRSAMPLAYDLDVFQGGLLVGQVECTTASASTRVCGSYTYVKGSHDGDCEVRMSCELPALGAGEVLLRVTGRLAAPERVELVRNMSLNVRAK
jgi:hypothetical protein